MLTQWNVRNASYRPRLSAALHAGEIFHYEDEVTRKDGTTFLVGVSTTPIFDEAGGSPTRSPSAPTSPESARRPARSRSSRKSSSRK